jgi:integral membrane protein (TIGR00529 family)
LESVSPVLRLLAVFAFLVLLIRVRVPIAVAMALSAIPLGIVFGMSWDGTLEVAGEACVHPETLLLAGIILGIIVLSRLMQQVGSLGRMVDAFGGLGATRRTAVAFFPALIGLLPMPGGAAFSAPMVEEASRGGDTSGETLSLSNYWFRHIHEYWWPLYPGPILTTAMMGVPLGFYILGMLPLSIAAVLVGIPLYLRGVSNGRKSQRRSGSFVRFLRTLYPIALVVGATVSGQVVDAIRPGLLGEWAVSRVMLVVGLGAAWTMVARGDASPGALVRRVLFSRDVILFVSFAFAIMIFKDTMIVSGAVGAIRDELSSWGVPFGLGAAVLGFLVGLVTGIAPAFIGATFPLVAAGTAGLPTTELMGYTALVYSWGFMGVMLSPVHLCFILTVEHFKGNLAAQLPRVMPGAAFVMLVGLGVYSVLV